MYRQTSTKIGTHDPKNNFALKAHRDAKKFAAIGGQLFNYNINVRGNIMYLTFRTAYPAQTVKCRIDLSDHIGAYGRIDEKDHPHGYSGDTTYFKAGANKQCRAKDDPAFRCRACAGSGNWATDKPNSTGRPPGSDQNS